MPVYPCRVNGFLRKIEEKLFTLHGYTGHDVLMPVYPCRVNGFSRKIEEKPFTLHGYTGIR